jgi:hypothetical protein
MTRLVVWRPPLDLAMLAAYRKVTGLARIARRHHDQLLQQIETILNRVADEYCTLELEELERLKRELRLITKGTPLTEALTPEDKDPLLRHDPNFSQAQYDAETVLLKGIYRKLAMLAHPDRGGDRTAWDEVEVAYNMRDVPRLNAIWFSIVEGRNLYWQQSSGVYHSSNELQRYRVNIEKLKQTEGWRAARLYMANEVNSAVDVVRLHLADRIAALMNEINYTHAKRKHHGKEGRQEGQEIGESGEDYQGEYLRQGWEESQEKFFHQG